MLASDEAVSHALEIGNLKTLKTLEKLKKKPYFARIVLEEDTPSGDRKFIEYKIGFSANPDCRIIDWKKAPISKLFYEYREGDEYSETIQGIERTGKILVRNTFEIEDSDLRRINCKFGEYKKTDQGWKKLSGRGDEPSRSATSHMPSVLALITPEQFRSITEDAETAILIQGIAGSGKTTVALHRLAWLLGEGNSDLQVEKSLVLTQTNSLKTYINNTLPTLGVSGAKVRTMSEWLKECVAKIAPKYIDSGNNIRRANNPSPRSIHRLKHSMAFLNCLEEVDLSSQLEFNYGKTLQGILSQPENIIKHDETKLIDKELIKSALLRLQENEDQNCLDSSDDALVLKLYERQFKKIPLSFNDNFLHHIVVDEVQDFSVVEIAAIIGAVNNVKNLTLVGDTSQKIDAESTFPGWDRLRRNWDHKESVSKFIQLNVSHRSTLPIMKFADHIQQRDLVKEGRPGRVPIWFRAAKESKGLESCINWLSTAIERYPTALTAIICPTEQEAKYALSLLKPTFGEMVRAGDNISFSFDAGLMVTDVRQVKGLEFFNVLIWNPSEKNYPSSHANSQNLLYIAATRAEENLCIVTWGKPTSLLPAANSSLVRCFQVKEEEEEN